MSQERDLNSQLANPDNKDKIKRGSDEPANTVIEEYQRLQLFLRKNTGIKSLRELFDSLSAEFNESSIKAKLNALQFIHISEESLEGMVRIYQLSWRDRKDILEELPLTIAMLMTALVEHFQKEGELYKDGNS